LVAGLVIGCGQAVGEDVRLYNPDLENDCARCDLKGIDLKSINPVDHLSCLSDNGGGPIPRD
jgi:hypothetical protein